MLSWGSSCLPSKSLLNIRVFHSLILLWWICFFFYLHGLLCKRQDGSCMSLSYKCVVIIWAFSCPPPPTHVPKCHRFHSFIFLVLTCWVRHSLLVSLSSFICIYILYCFKPFYDSGFILFFWIPSPEPYIHKWKVLTPLHKLWKAVDTQQSEYGRHC